MNRNVLSRTLRSWVDRLAETVIVAFIFLCGWSAILFVLAIFMFVFREAAPMLLGGFDQHEFFTSANPLEYLHGCAHRVGVFLVEFFTSPNWHPTSTGRAQYGILALLLGSLSVTTLAMALAVPLGLGAAVYISEFCTGKLKEMLKIVIELLAAIPSVVWGFIGYMVLNPIIIWATGAPIGINVLNGGIILALMSVPIIVSVGEDALKAVPDSFREAALSLGASRWEIVYRVLFPAARAGLLAAVLLGVGRAVGETMAVLMATGHSVQIPHSVLDPIRTLTATIASELGEADQGEEHYRVLFLIGVVLFVITFIVNLTADLVVKGTGSQQDD